jgi:ethanolamine utilization protein EutA
VKTRQLLSVGIDIGTTTTQVIFSRLELVNRAAVSQVPRYEFIKREISWQSPVFFTPVDKQGGLKEAELKALILAQYQAAGIAPESVDSGAIIITGESAKTRNARPAVMALSQSLGDFVVASAGPHLESVIAGHGAGAQTLSEQRLCRVLNIDIGGGTSNYALFDAGKVSATACLNVGGRLLETDAQGRVVHAHQPGQMIVDAVLARHRAGADRRAAGAGGAPDGGADRRSDRRHALSAGATADANRPAARRRVTRGDYPFRRSGRVLPQPARRSVLFF